MNASPLPRVPFGRLGDSVTPLGFGAWAIGSKSYGQVDRGTAAATIRAYLQAGGNFIDTARGYGQSESVIGEVLREDQWRDQVFLCTKVGPTEPEAMRETFEESLRQLEVDCVDLLYLHSPPEEPDAMHRAIDQIVQFQNEGKVRAIGASIKGPNVTQATLDLHRQYIRTGRIDAIQLIYSILRPDARAIFDEAKQVGVALVGRTMLESGLLTGKYRVGHQFPEGDHRQRWNDEKLAAIIDASERLQQEFLPSDYQSVTELALRFTLDEPGLTTIIPGAKSPQQMEANIAAATRSTLEPTTIERLQQAFGHLTPIVNPS